MISIYMYCFLCCIEINDKWLLCDAAIGYNLLYAILAAIRQNISYANIHIKDHNNNYLI